jgi:hypothetical protein
VTEGVIHGTKVDALKRGFKKLFTSNKVEQRHVHSLDPFRCTACLVFNSATLGSVSTPNCEQKLLRNKGELSASTPEHKSGAAKFIGHLQ